MPNLIDLTGQRYGNLVVVERDCLREKGRPWATAKEQANNRRPRRWAKKPKEVRHEV